MRNNLNLHLYNQKIGSICIKTNTLSLIDKTPLRILFSKTKFNDVNERCGLDGSKLFENYKF